MLEVCIKNRKIKIYMEEAWQCCDDDDKDTAMIGIYVTTQSVVSTARPKYTRQIVRFLLLCGEQMFGEVRLCCGSLNA